MSQLEQNQWGDRLNAYLSVVPKFKVGDVCFLNSGSPAMTVVEVRPAGIVDVTWTRCGEPQGYAFPVACLRRATWLDRLNAAFGG
jgi:uncharacterized protein YodC (DUF2158 family)